MRLLIIARHGEYDTISLRLNENGKRQMRMLAKNLQVHVGDASVIVLSSKEDRVKDSAQVFADVFGVSFEGHELLSEDASRESVCEKVLELVRSRQDGCEVLILVTHLELMEHFPAYFGKVALGCELYDFVLDFGTACVIDCEAKTLTHVDNTVRSFPL
jgi:phosphohistidine phosphatase SixA